MTLPIKLFNIGILISTKSMVARRSAQVTAAYLRSITYEKIDQLPQGHGLAPLRRHSETRLILYQRGEYSMVEALVQMGDDQDDDSSTPPHHVLPTMANPELADHFATQYTKLMEKEGWELIEDQVQAAMPRGDSAMTNAGSSARPMSAGATTLGNTMARPGSSPRMPTNQQHMPDLSCPWISPFNRMQPPPPNALAAARMPLPANSTRQIMGNYFGQSVAGEPVQMDVTGSELTGAQQQEQQQLQHSVQLQRQQQEQSQRPQQLVALPTQNNGDAMNQQQQLQQYSQLHHQQEQQQEQSQRPKQLPDAHQLVAVADQNNGQAMNQQQQLLHYPQLQQQQQHQSQRQEQLLGAQQFVVLADQNIGQAMNQRHQQQEQQQLQRYLQLNLQQQQEQQQLQHQLQLLQHQQQESQRLQQLLSAQQLDAQLAAHNDGQAINQATQIQQLQFSGYSLSHRRQQHQQQQNMLQQEMMLPASMNMSMNVPGSNFSGMNGVGLAASGGSQGVAMSNLSGLGQMPGMSNSMGGMPGLPNMGQLPGMSTMGAGGVANMMQQQLRPEMNLAPTAAAGPIVSKRRRGRPRTGAGNSPVRSPMDNLPMAGANQMQSASGVPLMEQAMARPGMQASQRPSAAGMGFPEVGTPVVAVGTDGQGDYLNLQQLNARQISTVETLVWGRPSPQIGSEGLGSVAGLTSSGMDPQNGSVDGTLAAVVASGRGHVRRPMLAPQPEEVGTDDQGDYLNQQKLNAQQISTVGTLVRGGPSPQIGSDWGLLPG